ncbi:flagellar hook-length control protein FliK [Desemzia incerta]|uniref:flagellar hook-length control protein FliK n=1 Tax=Desemzia incerta TaxID=82801 RepID=UPI0024C4724E|nr:flagellar hook-length control protein FliK [Desemzia incerta]WHZ32341.1 flagellar hook-length control protein FliK [Desemzia incerta]
MQATQSIPALHTQSGSLPESTIPVDAIEFTAQLTESMQKNGQQSANQAESGPVLQTEVSEKEMDQEAEQADSLDEQIDPNIAAFFYQPLKMAEQQLTAQLEPALETGEVASVSEESKVISSKELSFDHSTDIALENTRAVLEDANGQHIVPKEAHLPISENKMAASDLSSDTINQATVVSQNNEGVFKTQAQTLKKDAADSTFMNAENTVIDLVSTNKVEKNFLSAMGLNTENTVLPEFEQVIEQVMFEQITEEVSTGQDDLDIQSQLRMKVSGSFTDQLTAVPTQTANPQKEIALPVMLTSESSSKNQQVLTQAISEVIFDQSAGLKEGQQTTARLSLSPESLGNMKIEIQIREQQLYTTIVVESTETKELMDNSMKQLTASLAQKNIHLQEMTVQINLPQATDFSFAGSSQHEAGNQDHAVPSRFTESTDNNTDSTVVEEETAASTGRLSILA